MKQKSVYPQVVVDKFCGAFKYFDLDILGCHIDALHRGVFLFFRFFRLRLSSLFINSKATEFASSADGGVTSASLKKKKEKNQFASFACNVQNCFPTYLLMRKHVNKSTHTIETLRDG